MRDRGDTVFYIVMMIMAAALAAFIVVGMTGILIAAPIAALFVILVGFILMLIDDKKRQTRLFKLMIDDQSGLFVPQRIHELAVVAQERFAENEAIQQKTPAELDSPPDRELSHKRFHAHRLANNAKSNFWALHNYLVGYFGYKFPYTKIRKFAANDPRQAPWPTSAEVSKQEQPRGRDEAVPST